MNNPSISKSFSGLTLLTVFEKAVAFFFQAIIALLLGTSAVTDAYFLSSELFGFFEVSIFSALTVVALNKFIRYLNEKGESYAYEFLSKLLSFYFPIVTILSVCIFCFAQPLSFFIAPGFVSEARKTLVLCIRIMACIPLVECFTAIGMAILRQKKRFLITGLKSLFISVIGIIFVVGLYRFEINNAVILSIAYVISMTLFCGLTLIAVKKFGKLRLTIPIFDSEIKGTICIFTSLIASYGITRFSMMIGKIFASFLGNGAVSQLTYAHNLFAVVNSVFNANLSIILLTDFRELVVIKNYQMVIEKIKYVVSIMTTLLIPITIVSIVCSKDIVKIVYERGLFMSETTNLVANILAIYAISFIPSMFHGIYNQFFYAVEDVKTPMFIAFSNIVINIITCILLLNKIGLKAIAIAYLLSSIVATFISEFKVKRYLTGFKGCYSNRSICLNFIAGIVCTICTNFTQKLNFSSLLVFILSTIVAFLTFLLTLFILKEPFVRSMIQTQKSMFCRKK